MKLRYFIVLALILSACGTTTTLNDPTRPSDPPTTVRSTTVRSTTAATRTTKPTNLPTERVVKVDPTRTNAPSTTVKSTTVRPATAASGIKMPGNLPKARVVKVVDGDTLDVTLDGKTQRVRLIGMNTPESVDPRRPVQCFGIEASTRLKDLLQRQTVSLESDPSQDSQDQFGRLLRYVWLPDGRNANLLMLSEGYANEYTFNLPYKYQSQFKAAARQAKQNQLGLWSPRTCNGDFNSPTKAP
jgi:micrococcal nuclease